MENKIKICFPLNQILKEAPKGLSYGGGQRKFGNEFYSHQPFQKEHTFMDFGGPQRSCH
jgi:hypothetical protein